MLTVKNPAEPSVAPPSVFNQLTDLEHEQVTFCYDKHTGLKSIIAIHDTTLGPALGGTRMWNYQSEQAALRDVLRLSRGMTYKAAITGINLGGGKAVIIGDSATDKSETLWRRYGKFVNSLGGRYITAEDVGTSTADMEYVAMETKYVTGKPAYLGGGGDPSPFTAYGTFLGIKASKKYLSGNDSLHGARILVQGVGHVGQHLVKHLTKAGAIIYVADINEAHLAQVSKAHKVNVIPAADVFDYEVDIYAPCALGATINDESMSKLTCSIVAGAANNQLEDEQRHGRMLKDEGIIYAPDFLINAGGLINVFLEWEGYNKDRALRTTEKIYERTLEIFERAAEKDITTHEAALEIAAQRIEAIGKLKALM